MERDFGAFMVLSLIKDTHIGSEVLVGEKNGIKHSNLGDVMLCYVMLCYVMLCYVMLCYVMLCYVMLCYVMLCYVMLC